MIATATEIAGLEGGTDHLCLACRRGRGLHPIQAVSNQRAHLVARRLLGARTSDRSSSAGTALHVDVTV